MPEIRKRFRCPQCNRRAEVWIRPDDDDPVCPYGCRNDNEAVQTQWEPGSFAIGSNKGKALDIAQNIIEQDFGVTNFNDQQREGDIAYKAEPETREKRAEKEQVVDAVRTNLAGMAGLEAAHAMSRLGMKSPDEFWGSGKGFSVAAGDAMSEMKGKSDPSVNPMRMLHKGVEGGEIGDPVKKFRPLARG